MTDNMEEKKKLMRSDASYEEPQQVGFFSDSVERWKPSHPNPLFRALEKATKWLPHETRDTKDGMEKDWGVTKNLTTVLGAAAGAAALAATGPFGIAAGVMAGAIAGRALGEGRGWELSRDVGMLVGAATGAVLAIGTGPVGLAAGVALGGAIGSRAGEAAIGPVTSRVSKVASSIESKVVDPVIGIGGKGIGYIAEGAAALGAGATTMALAAGGIIPSFGAEGAAGAIGTGMLVTASSVVAFSGGKTNAGKWAGAALASAVALPAGIAVGLGGPDMIPLDAAKDVAWNLANKAMEHGISPLATQLGLGVGVAVSGMGAGGWVGGMLDRAGTLIEKAGNKLASIGNKILDGPNISFAKTKERDEPTEGIKKAQLRMAEHQQEQAHHEHHDDPYLSKSPAGHWVDGVEVGGAGKWQERIAQDQDRIWKNAERAGLKRPDTTFEDKYNKENSENALKGRGGNIIGKG